LQGREKLEFLARSHQGSSPPARTNNINALSDDDFDRRELCERAGGNGALCSLGETGMIAALP
jgi:hypothetical protein